MCIFHKWSKWEKIDDITKEWINRITKSLVGKERIIIQSRQCKKCDLIDYKKIEIDYC